MKSNKSNKGISATIDRLNAAHGAADLRSSDLANEYERGTAASIKEMEAECSAAYASLAAITESFPAPLTGYLLITNALPPSVLSGLYSDGSEVLVSYRRLSMEEARGMIAEGSVVESGLGHADIVAQANTLLGTNLSLRRESTPLRRGDRALIVQRVGGRLPEGAPVPRPEDTYELLLATVL